jgi:ABC-2 type transport system permease protein
MPDALIMAGRSLRLSARSPEALLTALMLPVMLMVVFVYLFGGAVSIGTRYVAAAFGLLVRAPEAAGSAMFFLMFFSYASSAFVPVRTMPAWLRGFAGHQPATPVTETIRGLLLGHSSPLPLGAVLAWCLGIGVVSMGIAAVLFRRRTT